MPDENLTIESLREHATLMVHDWIFVLGIDHWVLNEPVRIIRSGVPYEEAAKQVEGWFRDLLTDQAGVIGSSDSAVQGLFTGLTHNLLGTMFDLVSWESIVGAMRRRED